MRAFVSLFVPALSLLSAGVNAATISGGLLSRESDGLVARRQFHNADFNSDSESHPHHHAGHDHKEDSLSRRQDLSSLDDTSSLIDTSNLDLGLGDAVARRQLPTSAVGGIAAQATTVVGSTPAGGVLGSASSASSSAARRQVDTVTSAISSALEDTPAAGVVGGAASTTARRQLSLDALPISADSITGATSRRQVPSVPDPSSLVPAGIPPALPVSIPVVGSGTTTARGLKDVAQEDIAEADEDLNKDLKDVPESFDVLSEYPDLSNDSESDVKEKRQTTNLTAIQESVVNQELVQSLTSNAASA